MIRTLLVVAALLVASPALAEPVFLLAGSNITDKETFFEVYGPLAYETLQEHGATIYFASADHQAIEGEWDRNWTVALSFPSEKAASDWYNSEAYTAARKYRMGASEDGLLIQFRPVPAN